MCEAELGNLQYTCRFYHSVSVIYRKKDRLSVYIRPEQDYAPTCPN